MENNKAFSSSGLKIIAIIAMFIDHFAGSGLLEIMYKDIFNTSVNYQNTYNTFRIIGRIAFPIFAFLIVNGFFYTKNPWRYFSRLSLFAFISEIPFDLALHNKLFDFNYQNVFFTLALGLLAIILFDRSIKNENKASGILYLILIIITAFILNTDYNAFGILIIFGFYGFRNSKKGIFRTLFFINFLMIAPYLSYLTYGFDITIFIQMFAVFSIIFIFNYNHKKGINLKYFFYVFYPLHLLVLYFIRDVIY